MAVSTEQRGFWASKVGFILAAAGSAVGLGNIWKFPYVTGNNGGGFFIVLYLICVVLVGLPIMNAEVLIGTTTQRSPVAAFSALTKKLSPWLMTGWMGVIAGFVILSFYSVVAGWALYYGYYAIVHGFGGLDQAAIPKLFSELTQNGALNTGLHALFMAATVGVVIGGVQSGIERWSRLLMPALFIMLIGLAIYALTLDGAGQALDFMFGLRAEQLKPTSFLEAMGQAFFSLSLGMGAMLTYGSYLPKEVSVFKSTLWIAALDTFVATIASVVIFPVTFSYQIKPTEGPGLVFMSLPMAFAQMPGGRIIGILFFLLLIFAALTSSISLLEVVASTFIDLWGWSRKKAVTIMGVVIFFVGIPSALSFSTAIFGNSMANLVGKNFFDVMDYLSSNWLLPGGGVLIAIFVAWVMPSDMRKEEFNRSTPLWAYRPWLVLLKFIAPIAVAIVMLKSTGILAALGL